MSASTEIIASDILNRVAAEVGIAPVADPFASNDPVFVQLRYLLNTAGEELMQAFQWQRLVNTHTFVTTGLSGAYALPADFGRIINQTCWDLSNNRAVYSAVTPQQWAAYEGSSANNSGDQLAYRITDGGFYLLPNTNPPAANIDLSYEYISTNWVSDGGGTPVYSDEVTMASDVPLFDKTLITRALKVKYLEAGGFDTSKAQADYNQIFAFLTGSDKGGAIINAGMKGRGFRYLNDGNLPDTGFGL